jgi:DNA repair photolyase
MKPIYIPKGKAKEYGDYAINIYTGCPHRCYYCFAPSVLHRDRETFHSRVEPREGVVEAVKRQLDAEHITDKLIHLCFTCDPYPTGYDSTATREIIKLLKDNGNHVQILTKGDGERDFDLLDGNDWYGATITGYSRNRTEPGAITVNDKIAALREAHWRSIKTWVSHEPVIDEDAVFNFLQTSNNYVDRYKIGKLNYHPSDINWAKFGREVERVCKERGLDYYIKDSLRAEMEEK